MSKALKALISATHAKVNRPAVEAGISQLEVGEDFVDAVIAYEGKWIGGETFVSFDKKAISLLKNKINKRNRLFKLFRKNPNLELKCRISNLNFEISAHFFQKTKYLNNY